MQRRDDGLFEVKKKKITGRQEEICVHPFLPVTTITTRDADDDGDDDDIYTHALQKWKERKRKSGGGGGSGDGGKNFKSIEIME